MSLVNSEEVKVIAEVLESFQNTSLTDADNRQFIARRIEHKLREYWKEILKRQVVNSKIKLDVNNAA